MIKKFNRSIRGPIFRINERIYALQLRVLDTEGKQIGLMSKAEALTLAREQGLDLVEVAPTAKPPVARIIDYNKFLYQLDKKKREEKRKAKVSETKEVRLGPFMNDHDLDVMVRRAKEFLEESNKVRLVLKFKGRQITHPEFGQQIVKKVVAALDSISRLEREAHFEGKQLIALLAPDRKLSKAKSSEVGNGSVKQEEKGEDNEKNQEISTKAV